MRVFASARQRYYAATVGHIINIQTDPQTGRGGGSNTFSDYERTTPGNHSLACVIFLH